ncbi:MAG: T9SS type A sorting domain-containing protein [Flavobacteriales bacterium]|nr:T9SS type A sorting domain-containing protein [Flavobacteriales bacterium]
MTRAFPFAIVLLLSFGTTVELRAQCFGCTPDQGCTVDPPFPTLCPATPPDATVGVYYEADFTFWMPATFTDPGSGFAVDLLQLTITGVSGLPFGLAFTPSEPSGVYDPQDNEFGCARVCGTPLGAGSFTVTISVLAHVSASGFELDVPQDFNTVITVLPGSGGNTSFSYEPTSGCGSVTSSFSALIDASPSPMSYAWDFGNGNTSGGAQPPVQTYSSPGTYVITLETTIGGYVLNTVNLTGVNGNWCGDVEEPDLPIVGCTGSPDPYFVLTNGTGGTYTSSTVDNSSTGTWSGLGVLLDTPPYSITFYDEDAVSQNDQLGTYNIPANGEGIYFINVAGGTTGSLIIENVPQQIFTDSDTVTVFAMPDVVLGASGPDNELCVEDVTLASYTWLLDGAVVPDANSACFMPTGPGLWQVVGTNGFGCSDTSNTIAICPAFEIVHNGNVLFVPSGYIAYQWTLNGAPIAGNDAFVFLQGDGTYGVTVDAGNGCIITDEYVHDTSSLNEMADDSARLAVFPVPNSGAFTIVAEGLQESTAQIFVLDVSGRVVLEVRASVSGGRVLQDVALSVPAGAYLVRVVDGQRVLVGRTIVR